LRSSRILLRPLDLHLPPPCSILHHARITYSHSSYFAGVAFLFQMLAKYFSNGPSFSGLSFCICMLSYISE
jgi:hypothetical protein